MVSQKKGLGGVFQSRVRVNTLGARIVSSLALGLYKIELFLPLLWSRAIEINAI